jgi:hypothetical protein
MLNNPTHHSKRCINVYFGPVEPNRRDPPIGSSDNSFSIVLSVMWYYCAVSGESKKQISRVGQRKKSRVAEPRVIFGVPTSENNF